MRRLPCFLVVFATAAADPGATAARVVEAFKQGDTAGLARLARRDNPDPWAIAALLCGQGRHDAAAAFAGAAPRPDTEGLPEYVGARRAGRQPDAYAAAREHFDRGKDLQTRRAYEESGKAFAAAAEHAARAGWRTGRAWALAEAARSAFRRSDFPGMVRLAGAARTVEESLRCRQGVARALLLEAIAQARLGRNEEAASSVARALAIAEEIGDVECRATALTQRGFLRYVRGEAAATLADWTLAVKLLDRVPAEAAVARFAPDPGLLARTRVDLRVNTAALAQRAGRLEDANRLLERAGREARDAGLPSLEAKARTMAGAIAAMRGATLAAVAHYETALDLARAAGDRAQEATLLRRLGALRQRLGDNPGALDLLERSVALLTELKVRRDAAYARLALAHTLRAMAEYDRALDVYAIVRREATELKDASLLGNATAGLAHVHRGRGAYGTALELLREGLAAHERAGNREGFVRALGARGWVYAAMGDPERARADYATALERCDASVSPDARADVLLMLAAARLDEDEPEAAAALARQAHAIRAKAGDRAGMADALHLEVDALVRQNAYERAIAVARTALDHYRSAGRHADVALAQVSLAKAQLGLGRHDEALAGIAAAVTEAEESGNLNAVLACRWCLAAVHNERGEAAKAVDVAREALAEMERLGAGLAEEEGAGTRARFAPVFKIGTRAAMRLGDAQAVAFFLESGRARTLLRSLGGRDVLRTVAVPEALRREEAEARADEALALARLREARAGRKRKEIRAARASVDRARDALAEVITRIQRAARAGADLAYPAVAGLERLQSSLAPGDTLVLYGLVRPDAVALVVPAKGRARIVRLGDPDELADACRTLLDDVTDPDRPAAPAALRSLLIDPLRLDAGTKRLVVSPDGILAYVPFALVAGDRDVAYAVSGTAHASFARSARPSGTRVLAVGDPAYDGELPQLPGSRAEAEAVGDVVLLGEKATVACLAEALAKGEGEGWRAVHLACHGLVDPDRPALSSLALAPDERHDGRLRTLDIFRLEIAADLVMLSACETAKGKIVAGEGLFGFTRAFLFAGAPRVIVSLWKVDDEATRALMVKFYELWKEHSAATALRKAQHFVRSRKRWAHPRYWAAWQLWGLPE